MSVIIQSDNSDSLSVQLLTLPSDPTGNTVETQNRKSISNKSSTLLLMNLDSVNRFVEGVGLRMKQDLGVAI